MLPRSFSFCGLDLTELFYISKKADASIFPIEFSTHPLATVYAMAEKVGTGRLKSAGNPFTDASHSSLLVCTGGRYYWWKCMKRESNVLTTTTPW